MGDDAAQRRADRAERADFLVEAHRLQSERESAKAQLLVDRFVAEAKRAGLPTEELTARPWSGRGRYRTGILGWYVRKDHSIGIGEDGSYLVLAVPPVRFGRWRTVRVEPAPPPLVVGRGARDGESIDLEALLELRLRWPR
ncbi:MAG TPA: hypothetical protein VFG72_10470 [Marmoricola sp.]|nr:hypothetical protein [Marmoricola sp.]